MEPPTDTIFVESIEFYGYHGVSEAEQTVGHRYSVDVELTTDTRGAAASDALALTVDYADVARMIAEIGTRQRYRLLETLADAIARAVLHEFPASAVFVRVRKLRPPTNVIAASAGVTIRRTPEMYAVRPSSPIDR